MVFVT